MPWEYMPLHVFILIPIPQDLGRIWEVMGPINTEVALFQITIIISKMSLHQKDMPFTNMSSDFSVIYGRIISIAVHIIES